MFNKKTIIQQKASVFGSENLFVLAVRPRVRLQAIEGEGAFPPFESKKIEAFDLRS